MHAVDSNTDPVMQARVDLAAALRLAVYHELEEGIDNHFTVSVPGYDDRYLVLPFGLHWSEARASDLIIFNEAGESLDGSGMVELSAQCIHAPITVLPANAWYSTRIRTGPWPSTCWKIIA